MYLQSAGNVSKKEKDIHDRDAAATEAKKIPVSGMKYYYSVL
jgi:hypothetical protein